MAEGTYYAWSPIANGVDEKGKTEYIKLGDKVSAADLESDDAEEEFQYLIDAKAVREQPYPEDLINSPVPPSDYFKNLLVGAAEGSLTEDQTKALSKMSIGFDDSSSSKLGPTSEDVEDVSGQTKTTQQSQAAKK